MKKIKISKAWWGVLLFFISIFLSVFQLPTPKASADSILHYGDSGHKTITSGPGSEVFTLNPSESKQNGLNTYDGNGNSAAGDCIDVKPSSPYSGVRYPTASSGICGGPAGYSCSGNQTANCGDGTNINIGNYTVYTGSWVDHSEITVQGGNISGDTFLDSHINNQLNFVDTAGGYNGCSPDLIDGFSNSNGADPANATGTATIHIYETAGGGNNVCTENDYQITFDKTSSYNFNTYFVWSDAGTITTSDTGTCMVFTQKGKGQPYYDSGNGSCSDSKCQSYMTADVSSPYFGQLVLRYNPNGGSQHFTTGFPGKNVANSNIPNIADASYKNVNGCMQTSPIKVAIGLVSNTSKAAGTGSTNQGSGASSNTPTLSCDAGLNPLNWVICAIVKGLVAIVGDLDNLINSLLAVGTNGTTSTPSQIFGPCNSNSCGDYQTAWATFRNISLGLLAIAGLVIVISQALGWEILDAYTIRKVLPRLLFAAIGITISWPLMKFFVDFTNTLGYGVRFLIYAPFHNLSTVDHLGGGGGIAVSLISAGAITAMGIMGLLSFVATAALAVLVAFVVLILRQIIIIMLIILAPVAIVAYILPNTQNAYKLWWESFSKALLMFPLITAFIAAGRVFSAVALDQGGGNAVNELVGFAAYFAPYFLIPATFRLAGGALRQIGGFVNDRGKGGFDRLRQYRAGKVEQNIKRARAGQRWNEDFGRFKNPFTGKQTSIGHIANRAAVNALDQDELLPYRLGGSGGKWRGIPGFRRGSAKLQDIIDQGAAEQSTKGFQELDKHGFHYEGYRALAGQFGDFKGTSTVDGKSMRQKFAEAGFLDEKTGQWRAPTSLGDLDAVSRILQESSEDKERLGGEHIAAQRGYLSTIKSDPDMAYADLQSIGALGLAAAGRAEPAALANIANQIQTREGHGRAQRVLETAQKITTRNRPDLRSGHGIVRHADGTYHSAYEVPDSATAVGSVLSIKGSDWAGAKAEAVEAASDTIVHIASGGTGNADDQRTVQEAIAQGLASPYNDAGQRKAWVEIQRRVGMSDEDVARRLRGVSVGDLGAGLVNPPDADGGGQPGGAVGGS